MWPEDSYEVHFGKKCCTNSKNHNSPIPELVKLARFWNIFGRFWSQNQDLGLKLIRVALTRRGASIGACPGTIWTPICQDRWSSKSLVVEKSQFPHPRICQINKVLKHFWKILVSESRSRAETDKSRTNSARRVYWSPSGVSKPL